MTLGEKLESKPSVPGFKAQFGHYKVNYRLTSQETTGSEKLFVPGAKSEDSGDQGRDWSDLLKRINGLQAGKE